MKTIYKTIIAVVILLAALIAAPADAARVDGLTAFGSWMADGQSSQKAWLVGGDIILKNVDSNAFVIKQRVAGLAVRNRNNDIQGEMTATILHLTLKKDWWGLYIAEQTGIFRRNVDGKDITRPWFGLELGLGPFNLPLEVAAGVDVIPGNYNEVTKLREPDNYYIYGMINFRL